MLSYLGFTAGGVAASSLASAWHSSIGNVAAGSLFSWLQSAGAAGGGATVWAIGPALLYLVAHRSISRK